MNVSIVTPWRNAPELLADYDAATAGAHVVIVDHLSAPDNAAALRDFCARRGGFYLRDDGAWNFARLNNRGLRRAVGEVVIFANNDISADGPWLAQATRDCGVPGVLVGPSLLTANVAGRALLYIEGWCIGAHRHTWDSLQGWNEHYTGGYWEDNDLAFRAIQAGYALRRGAWPLRHKSNYTSSATPGAYAHSEANRERFAAEVAHAYR